MKETVCMVPFGPRTSKKMRLFTGLICILMGFPIQVNCSEKPLPLTRKSTDANRAARLQSWIFDPLVVSSSGDQTVSLRVQTNGSAPEVKLLFASGAVRLLDPQGNGLFTTTLSHDEVFYGNWQQYVDRNYIGQLDLGLGEIYPLTINVDDGGLPEAGVLDLDETTRVSPRIVNFRIPNQGPTQLNIEEVTRLFYQHFPDEYDFMNVVTAAAGPGKTYFINVRNSVLGLGLGLFDQTARYGSSGRLEGIVGIPNPMHFDLAGPEYLRMLGYNWMNYSQSLLLAGATPHWPVSTLAAGIMGFQPPGSNEFHVFPYELIVCDSVVPYGGCDGEYILMPVLSPLVYNSMERYLMGLIPASSVGTYRVFQNQHQKVCLICQVNGPFLSYGVNDLQNLHGPRIPDAMESRKNFRTATVVVSGDRLLSPLEMRHFDHMAARGEASGQLPYSRDDGSWITYPFRPATGGNGSLEALITDSLIPNINEGLNGVWYDDELPGQGFFVDVYPQSKTLFIGWFTYETLRPEERESRMGDAYHRWMTAFGEYSANRADLTLYRTIGGVFNSGDPVQNLEIGKLVFSLNDCSHAEIAYDIDAILRDGQISISRITNDHAALCETLQPDPVNRLTEPTETGPDSLLTATPAEKASQATAGAAFHPNSETFQINEGLSGTWFNPDWPGQGFFIDVMAVQEKVFVGWFTFDTERLYESGPNYSMGDLNQRWLTALGDYQGNQAFLELALTSGGVFLSEQSPATSREYGVLDLEFSDCETATVRYEIPELNMVGKFPLQKISDETHKTCEILAADPP